MTTAATICKHSQHPHKLKKTLYNSTTAAQPERNKLYESTVSGVLEPTLREVTSAQERSVHYEKRTLGNFTNLLSFTYLKIQNLFSTTSVGNENDTADTV